jgi:hypothetical protein
MSTGEAPQDGDTRTADAYEALFCGDPRAERFMKWTIGEDVDQEEVLRKLMEPFYHLLRAHALVHEIGPPDHWHGIAGVLASDFLEAWDRAVYRPVRGYVYFVGSEEYGVVKIGKANDLSSRIGTIALQLPFRVEVLHSIECANPDAVEKEYHRKFAEKRKNGEWFALTPEDLEEIKSVTYLETSD